MENIYIGHSKDFDYKEELYKPLRESILNKRFNMVFPHKNSNEPFNSKEFLKICKYMIAEVSISSLGLGVEIGWANSYGADIIFIYKEGSTVSSSLKVVSNVFIEYKDGEDLINKLEDKLTD